MEIRARALVISYISCLVLQSAASFRAVAEEWDEPINFRAWLEYIDQTSDPDPTIREMTPTESHLPAILHLPNADPQADTMKSNLFIPKRKIVVDKSGKGDFTTIQAAVNAVAHKNRERVTIRIRPGVYKERVLMPKEKPYITFQGYPNRTIITFDSIASDVISPEDNTTLSTFGSATNSAPIPPPGSVGKQAVAFRISGDMAAFYCCQFLGGQDTLYDHHGRHIFEYCYIEGTIDFVFGNGRSLYKNCILNALDNYGEPVYLGRAWGNYSRVIYARCYMDEVVIPVGWDDWGIKDRERTSFYAEFNCTGPGAQTSGRAPWSRILNAKQAKPFLFQKTSTTIGMLFCILFQAYIAELAPEILLAALQSAGSPAKASAGSPDPRDSVPSEMKPSAGFILRKFEWGKLLMIISVTGGFFV
ncbi:hypothetical protein R1flu_027755 [Riccia fluitans]|uniref:Pectinesterase n=1 Tax=Riccia fluitans TaxID=41844 RepID=A0ABD1XJR5_9MARC